MSADRARRLSRWALGGAGIGGALCVGGGLADLSALLRGWLAAWSLWIGLSLGALLLLAAQALTGGRWGDAVRPPLAAAAAALPVTAILMLPLLLGLDRVYPWARPEIAAVLPNRAWLEPGFFLIRAVVVLLVWSALGLLAARRWRSAGAGGTPLACATLMLGALTATVAAVDWSLSLQPDVASSIYGMLTISGHLLGALALATLVALLAGGLEASVRSDLGSLLLAGILLWAYLAFMQFLIVWKGNLPTEARWYLVRGRGPWADMAVAQILFQAVLPLLVLLWWPLKRSRLGLAAACGLILLGHVLEWLWLVLPGSGDGSLPWQAGAALLAIGGVWLWRLAAPLAREEARHG